MTYAGQLDCYGRSETILKQFIDIEVSAAQVYRVTDHYGKEAEKTVNTEKSLPPVSKEDVLYVEVDGSMLQTRTAGWKEVKVGRIFAASSCIDPTGKSSWIRHSQYCAYVGSSRDFTDRMNILIDAYGKLGNRLVFISDGGTWIKKWTEDAFCESVCILDYYHACEHLHEYANTVFKEEAGLKKWIEEQKNLLLNSQVLQVVENIKARNDDSKEAKSLINYYINNADRMDYKRYKSIGAGLIGSGAIESAHRTVVQKRMKQSGQHWSITGAQNMLNLRVLFMNEQWGKVVAMIKNAA